MRGSWDERDDDFSWVGLIHSATDGPTYHRQHKSSVAHRQTTGSMWFVMVLDVCVPTCTLVEVIVLSSLLAHATATV
jgi:hypothetical protein